MTPPTPSKVTPTRTPQVDLSQTAAQPSKADSKIETQGAVVSASREIPGPRNSLQVGTGYGWRNMGNWGMDHGGPYLKLEGARSYPLSQDGRVTFSSGVFYEFQKLSKALNPGESRANVHTFGIQGDLAYSPHPWFSAHLTFGLGAAHYTAPGSDDGSQGAEFNKNPILFPLGDTGAAFIPGLKLCTAASSVCAGFSYQKDVGVNPTLDIVADPKPTQTLSPGGLKVGVSIDVLRLAGIGKSKKVSSKPKADDVTVTNLGKPIASDEIEMPADVLVEKSVSLEDFAGGLEENKRSTQQATDGADEAKSALDIIKLKSTKPGKARENTEKAVQSFRTALKAMHQADGVVSDLESQVEGLKSEEQAKGKEFLRQARLLAIAANKQTRLAHDHATAAVKEYSKKRGDLPPVEFTDTKPDAGVVTSRMPVAPRKATPKPAKAVTPASAPASPRPTTATPSESPAVTKTNPAQTSTAEPGRFAPKKSPVAPKAPPKAKPESKQQNKKGNPESLFQ